MGFVLSKFQKEKSTEEVLEALQTQIQALEVHITRTQKRKRRLVTNFVGCAFGLYAVGLGLGYFFYYPSSVQEGVVCLVPLLLAPILIVLLSRLLVWYFEVKLNMNGDKLSKLKEEKRILLEQVMCQETYKVALNILERFDGKKEIKTEAAAAAAASIGGELEVQNQPLIGVEPVVQQVVALPPARTVQPLNVVQQQVRLRTPFPIIDDRSRGAVGRLMDFIVGDGPHNRYGMICKECYTHNGMLPKEEYEYASFWCAACNALNEARRVRPVSPSLQQDSPDSPETTTNIIESFD